MKDLRKYINTCTDRDILSEDVMTNPDRDIISIVIDAYSNLSDRPSKSVYDGMERVS